PWNSPFLLQAEDGIRDKLVTGVQTCALPISIISVEPERSFANVEGNDCAREWPRDAGGHPRGRSPQRDLHRAGAAAGRRRQYLRSEERRVGKSEDVGGCIAISNIK